MDHEELKSMMMGPSMQPFIRALFKELNIDRGDTFYKSFEEVSLRKPISEKQNGTYRADIVTFISTGNKEQWPKFYNRTNLSVILEVKAALSDLNRDTKYVNYLATTDFFFFAVPTSLCTQALYKTRALPTVGVVDIERGIIIKMPEPQAVEQRYYYELLEQLIYCQRPNSQKERHKN